MTTTEISFAGLYRQVRELRFMELETTGRTAIEAEVGPETWKVILKAANCEEKTVKEGWFAGVHVMVGKVPEAMAAGDA